MGVDNPPPLHRCQFSILANGLLRLFKVVSSRFKLLAATTLNINRSTFNYLQLS